MAKIKYSKEQIIYKSKKGKIVCTTELLVRDSHYLLLDASGQYIRDLVVPFRVTDYL